MGGKFNLKDRVRDPKIQALLILASCLAFQALAATLNALYIVDVEVMAYWVISAAFLLLYALFNAIIFLNSSRITWYWSRSLYCYLGLLLVLSVSGYLFSRISIGEADSIRWIYFIISLCYVIFLIIIYLMRKIIEYAQKQDTEYKK